MKTFPAIRCFTRYGELISAAFSAAIIAIAVWMVWTYALGWGLIVVGVVLGAAVGFLTMVFVELARIISEMMLPQE